MRIIISPAKQMCVDTDAFACTELPVFMEKTEILKDWISGLSYEEQKALWACNDTIAKQNAERFITCVFGEVHAGKVVQKGVYAKMARGEMVRFMAGIRTEEPEQIKTFNWSGYQFDESRSSDTEYVFIRKEIPGKR